MQETQKRSKHLLMINFVLITTILVLMPMPITISNVNAGGPRLDYDERYDERYEDVPGSPECWVNGYDAGFAGEYDATYYTILEHKNGSKSIGNT